MIEHNIKIFVRRAGPNYQEGLRRMREVGQTLGEYCIEHIYLNKNVTGYKMFNNMYNLIY